MMEYQIPLLVAERQCIAIMPRPKSKRCSNGVNKAEVIEAARQSRLVENLEGPQKTDAVRQILRLHICVAHRRGFDSRHAETEVFVQNYEHLLAVHGQPQEISPVPSELRLVPYTLPHQRVRDLLTAPIHPQQDVVGYLYSYTWPAALGFIKIGYAKDSVSKRVKQWAKCHAGARIHFSVEMPYPERMKSLIHAQMGGQRHEIAVCAVCGKRHTEIFKVSGTEAGRIVQQWREVAIEGGLYTAERRLSRFWNGVLSRLSATTAAELLNALALSEENHASKCADEIEADQCSQTAAGRNTESSDPIDILASNILRVLDLSTE